MFYILNMNQYHLQYYVLQQKKKIPRFSNAEIKNKFIKNNSGILNLILENPTDNTYKRVRILLRNNSKESGNLIIQDSDFNKVGTNTSYISSGSTGFTIEPNSILSIPINLLFDNDGLYEIQFDLVYLDSGNIITTNKFVVQVGNQIMATPISSFNNRKIQRIVFNGREIRKAVFNGLVVWTNDDSEPRLSLEKLSVFLSEQNNFQDTNQVYTNTTFSVE